MGIVNTALAGASGNQGYFIQRSLRFRSSASAYLNRTPASAGNRKTWTWSGWVKRGRLATALTYLYRVDSSNTDRCEFDSSDRLMIQQNDTTIRVSTQVFRDPSAWYHIIIAMDTTQATANDRTRVYVNGYEITAWTTQTNNAQNTDGNINSTNNHKFFGAGNTSEAFDGFIAELNFIDGQALTPSSFGETSTETGVWVPKKYTGTYGTNGFYLPFQWSSASAYAGSFNSSNQYLTLASNAAFAPGTGDFTIEAMVNFNTVSGNHPIFQNDAVGTSSTDKFYFNYDGTNIALGRHSTGTSSTAAWTPVTGRWYHIAAVRQSGITKIFVDGVSLTVANPTALNGIVFNQGGAAIGAISTPMYYNGYISNLRYVVGTAVYTSSFTPPSANLTAVSGTQILTLQNSTIIDNSANAATITNNGSVATSLQYPYQYGGIANDQSGNGNNWTPNNISTTAGVSYDSMQDVPTLTSTNAANFATLNPLIPAGSGVVQTIKDGNLTLQSVSGNGARNWSGFGMTSGKWYWEYQVTASPYYLSGGIVKDGCTFSELLGYLDANSWGWYAASGQKWNNNVNTAWGSAFSATTDVLGVAFDADAGSLYFYKNGTLQGGGAAFTGLTSGPYYAGITANGTTSYINFGQRPFSYTPPTGFKALNTFNLPDPTIKKPNQYMDATTYSGQNTSLAVTNSGAFQPDLLWIKARNGTDWHNLTDSVRGTGTNLFSNATNAEDAVARVTSFNTNGFTLAGAYGATNAAGGTYVGWQWKKGATPGFDIVTYTGNGVAGRTVAHSLGVAPSMIIVKARDVSAQNWACYHTSVGATKVLYLNATSAATTSSGFWNNTAPSSTVFSLGTDTNVNSNSAYNYVAYLFAEIAGFSKFGSYTGNGSSDGPFVYCGFRPRYIMIKKTDAASPNGWEIWDTARDTYNQAYKRLWANLSDAENTSTPEADILSNGFKVRTVSNDVNTSGGTYIFAAFAENPFKYSLAR